MFIWAGVTFLVGSVLFLLSGCWLIREAFRTSRNWGLLCLFLPPAWPLWAWRHREQGLRVFLFLLLAAGICVLSLGMFGQAVFEWRAAPRVAAVPSIRGVDVSPTPPPIGATAEKISVYEARKASYELENEQRQAAEKLERQRQELSNKPREQGFFERWIPEIGLWLQGFCDMVVGFFKLIWYCIYYGAIILYGILLGVLGK